MSPAVPSDEALCELCVAAKREALQALELGPSTDWERLGDDYFDRGSVSPRWEDKVPAFMSAAVLYDEGSVECDPSRPNAALALGLVFRAALRLRSAPREAWDDYLGYFWLLAHNAETFRRASGPLPEAVKAFLSLATTLVGRPWVQPQRVDSPGRHLRRLALHPDGAVLQRLRTHVVALARHLPSVVEEITEDLDGEFRAHEARELARRLEYVLSEEGGARGAMEDWQTVWDELGGRLEGCLEEMREHLHRLVRDAACMPEPLVVDLVSSLPRETRHCLAALVVTRECGGQLPAALGDALRKVVLDELSPPRGVALAQWAREREEALELDLDGPLVAGLERGRNPRDLLAEGLRVRRDDIGAAVELLGAASTAALQSEELEEGEVGHILGSYLANAALRHFLRAEWDAAKASYLALFELVSAWPEIGERLGGALPGSLKYYLSLAFRRAEPGVIPPYVDTAGSPQDLLSSIRRVTETRPWVGTNLQELLSSLEAVAPGVAERLESGDTRPHLGGNGGELGDS